MNRIDIRIGIGLCVAAYVGLRNSNVTWKSAVNENRVTVQLKISYVIVGIYI